ncbi:MAG TPA: AAA family ATPase [Bacteroidetes bacterium]|nr:AAA family ATPase [Bacteroidota bacterium]
MKILPIGRQTFSDIVGNGLLYVDKTKYLDQLANGGKYYFFSRPRRFGKSLTLSTLKSYFQGKKELFKGLAISRLEKKWQSHPVLLLDYSLVEYRSGKEVFHASLLRYLQTLSKGLGVEVEGNIVKNFFQELIIALFEKYGPVVILVDEYDKPLVDVLTEQEKFDENRDVLNGFYGVLKGLDDKLRFVMLTGVSRFAKVSVFSGLNNLEDITMDKRYQSLVGFTEEELRHYFKEHLAALAAEFEVSEKEVLQEMAKWYNGYSWGGEERVYNPFSILNLFNKNRFENYWFETGTPSFLIDLFVQQKELPEHMENVEVTDLSSSSNNPADISLHALLFQTGYLTILKKTRDAYGQEYILGYPNEEVRRSFVTYLMVAFARKDKFKIQPDAINLRSALRKEDPDMFLDIIRAYFANIPSRLHIPKEAYYHSLVYMILTLVGLKMDLEKPTDKGQIDGVMELPDKVYVIEFKFAASKRVKNVDTLAKQAIKQIEEKKYYEPYIATGKKILLFGIGFLNKKIGGKLKVLK